MKLKALLIALIVGLGVWRAGAQIVEIQASDTVRDSRVTINNNFAYLNSAIGGIGSLTTAKTVPFVTTPGLLGIDTQFCWDTVNHRLGIGTCDPTVELDVSGFARVTGPLRLSSDVNVPYVAFGIVTNGWSFSDATQHWMVLSRDLNGNKQSSIVLPPAGTMNFSASGDASGTADIGIGRSSAGLADIHNGSGTGYRDVKLRSVYFTGNTEATCDSTIRGAVVLVVAGAGEADSLRVCSKDVFDAYAWRPLN